MKIHPNTKYRDLTCAVDIAPACESSILKIDESTFAFCSEVDEQPHLVIESEIFSLLMQRMGARVVHFSVFRPRCLCCEAEGEVVIRLTEVDGYIYQLDQNDELEICMSVENLYDGFREKMRRDEIKPKRPNQN